MEWSIVSKAADRSSRDRRNSSSSFVKWPRSYLVYMYYKIIKNANFGRLICLLCLFPSSILRFKMVTKLCVLVCFSFLSNSLAIHFSVTKEPNVMYLVSLIITDGGVSCKRECVNEHAWACLRSSVSVRVYEFVCQCVCPSVCVGPCGQTTENIWAPKYYLFPINNLPHRPPSKKSEKSWKNSKQRPPKGTYPGWI